MEIALSKSLTAKEYHHMINEYYTTTYGLADVSTKTICKSYRPSIWEIMVGESSNCNFVNTVTSVSGILRENGEEFSFCHELSHSDLEKILCAKFSNYTIDDFSVRTCSVLSLFSKSGFKEKFCGIDVKLHKNIKNKLIRK